MTARPRPTPTAEALGLYRDLGDRPGQATALCYLGGVEYESGDYPAAAETLTQALALYRDLGDRLGQMNTLLWTGTLQRVTGDYLAAAGSLSRGAGPVPQPRKPARRG